MKTLLQNWGGTSLKGKAPLIYDAEAIFAERDWLHSKILGRELSPDALPAALHEEANLAKAADAVVVSRGGIALLWNAPAWTECT